MSPNSRILPVAGVLLIIGVSAASLRHAFLNKSVPLAEMAINVVRTPPAALGTKMPELAEPSASAGEPYMDGLRFRGTEGGRVLAYDIRTGRRVWETRIANPKLGESALAAPIAWKGLVLTGNAGGRNTGLNRRMVALEARTGRIVWEFLLVPKTEADFPPGPHRETSLDATTWGNASGVPITGDANWTSLTLNPATGELGVRGGSSAPRLANGSHEDASLYSSSVVVVDAKDAVSDEPFQAASRGLARLVRFQRARADPHAGRQEVPLGCTQGWASLWILDCLQFPAAPYADPPRRNR